MTCLRDNYNNLFIMMAPNHFLSGFGEKTIPPFSPPLSFPTPPVGSDLFLLLLQFFKININNSVTDM